MASCARCGKAVCHDCADAYGVSAGDYAGKVLCYDCARELVAENVQALQDNKRKITTTFVMTIIGMIAGAIFAISMYASSGGPAGAMILPVLLFMAIGGSFWTFIKGWARRIGGAISGGGLNWVSFAIGAVIGGVIEEILSIYNTIKKVIYCVTYLKKTSGFIEEDTQALQRMQDYMEYTLVRNQNRGVDLETLMGQGSALYNNSFAQSVKANGEEAAEQMLRRSTTTIAQNGEIIRSFDTAA